jgi:hypothetical protein
MNNRQSLLITAALFTFTSALHAAETLITFDDIPQANYYSGDIPADYKNLSWTNLQYINPFHAGGWSNSGAGTGIVSLSYDAISSPGVPAEIQSTTTFTLNSAYFAANLNYGRSITVKGELAGAIVHTQTFTVDTIGSTREFFNWQNIDTVLITTTGGTHHSSLSGTGTSFAMDNLIINSPVPEPETYAMLLAGLGLVAFMARRRKIS